MVKFICFVCLSQFTVLRNGCWQNIKYDREEPPSRSSADSRNHLKSPWICRLRRTGMKDPSPSEDMKEPTELAEEEETSSHGVKKSLHQFTSSNPNGDLLNYDKFNFKVLQS